MPVQITVQSQIGTRRYTIGNRALGNERYTMLRLQAYMSCLEAGYWSKANADDPAISDDLIRLVETASEQIETANANAADWNRSAARLQDENTRLQSEKARMQAEIDALRADNARLRQAPVATVAPRPASLITNGLPVFQIPVPTSIDATVADLLDRTGSASPVPAVPTMQPPRNGRNDLEID